MPESWRGISRFVSEDFLPFLPQKCFLFFALCTQREVFEQQRRLGQKKILAGVQMQFPIPSVQTRGICSPAMGSPSGRAEPRVGGLTAGLWGLVLFLCPSGDWRCSLPPLGSLLTTPSAAFGGLSADEKKISKVSSDKCRVNLMSSSHRYVPPGQIS